jgi:hypothetical protein
VVDAADYTIWRDTLGSTTDRRANGDNTGASAGVIDMADFLAWKTHFGESGLGASAFADSVERASVPEPLGTFPILVCIFCTLLARRRGMAG